MQTVQPSSILGLNINPLFGKNPCTEVKELQPLAFRWNTLYKISAVAFLAIAATVLFILCGTFTPPLAISLTLSALLLPSYYSFRKCSPLAHSYQEKFSFETLAAEEFKKIENWTMEDVKKFVPIHKDLKVFSLEYVLNVIARFRVYTELAESCRKENEVRRNLLSFKSLDALLEVLDKASDVEEYSQLPSACNAALMRQLLIEPTRKERNITELGNVYPQDGRIRAFLEKLKKDLPYLMLKDERMFYASQLRDLSIKDLQVLLFPPDQNRQINSSSSPPVT